MPVTLKANGRHAYDYSADLTPAEKALADRYAHDLPRLLHAPALRGLARLYPSWDDAVAVAAIGLMQAVRIYDPSVSPHPLTLIMWHLRSSLQRGLTKGYGESLIVTPRDRLGEAPAAFVAFDDPDWQGATALEKAVDPAPGPGDRAAFADEVRHALRNCRPMEKLVLRLRFAEGLTLKEVSDRIGVTKQRVSQIEATGLMRARGASQAEIRRVSDAMKGDRPRRKAWPRKCRHCRVKWVDRPRGLCWTCFYDPAISPLYPSTSKYAPKSTTKYRAVSA